MSVRPETLEHWNMGPFTVPTLTVVISATLRHDRTTSDTLTIL